MLKYCRYTSGKSGGILSRKTKILIQKVLETFRFVNVNSVTSAENLVGRIFSVIMVIIMGLFK